MFESVHPSISIYHIDTAQLRARAGPMCGGGDARQYAAILGAQLRAHYGA